MSGDIFQAIDQFPVVLKHTLLDTLPPALQPLASIILTVTPIILVFATLFAVGTVFERKGLGRIQNRRGPNRVGIPFTDFTLAGFGQPLADGIKALIKEDFIPYAADRVVHLLAPITMMIPVLLTYAVIPFGRNMVATDLEAGLLYFFAVGAGAELAVFMAGWSSRNKYSLLGALRAIAQMLSYEIPLILAAISVVMIAGTLSPEKIVDAQAGYTGWLPNWYVLTPWGLAGFLLFSIAGIAESNRSPFDLPEGESEIVAGYFIEYSGFKFALFFMAEYFGMFAMSGMAATLFLGGWHAPLPWLAWLPSWGWFLFKVVAFLFLFIWLRGTLPRLRMDQLMAFAWKFMIPLSLVNLVAAALWHLMGPGIGRWVLCSAIIAGSYWLLGNGLRAGKQLGKRIYRYAD
jgi:NADH-quinone oxidoreductase subunit H